MRLYCSSFQTMLNQTAVINSKGEPFELDLNLQDVNHNIEVEIRPWDGMRDFETFVMFT